MPDESIKKIRSFKRHPPSPWDTRHICSSSFSSDSWVPATLMSPSNTNCDRRDTEIALPSHTVYIQSVVHRFRIFVNRCVCRQSSPFAFLCASSCLALMTSTEFWPTVNCSHYLASRQLWRRATQIDPSERQLQSTERLRLLLSLPVRTFTVCLSGLYAVGLGPCGVPSSCQRHLSVLKKHARFEHVIVLRSGLYVGLHRKLTSIIHWIHADEAWRTTVISTFF